MLRWDFQYRVQLIFGHFLRPTFLPLDLTFEDQAKNLNSYTNKLAKTQKYHDFSFLTRASKTNR